MRTRLSAVLATALVPAALFFSATELRASGGGDTQTGESPLTRPNGAPDADAHGRIRVEHRSNGREKLNVEIEDVADATSFELWMENDSAVLTLVGSFTSQGAGEQEIEFDPHDGDPLPFNAPTVASLEGRDVEVQSGGIAYLSGSVPALGSNGGGDDNGGGGGGGGGWDKARSSLTRPAGAPDPDAHGKIETRRRASNARQRFQVEIEDVPASGVVFSAFVDDGGGTLTNVGALVPHEDAGEFELELDTGDGAQLPFGVADVDDLAGRAVEIRGDDALTYLVGTVPSLGDSLKQDKSNSTLDGGPGRAKIRARTQPRKASEQLEFEVKKANVAAFDVFIADPVSSVLTNVATLTVNGGGNAKLKLRTKRGQSLPFGVARVADLSGRAVELREAGTSNVVFTGSMPSF